MSDSIKSLVVATCVALITASVFHVAGVVYGIATVSGTRHAINQKRSAIQEQFDAARAASTYMLDAANR